MEDCPLGHLYCFEAVSALPEIARLSIRLAEEVHVMDYAKGAFSFPMDEPMQTHGVKNLDQGLVEHRLHSHKEEV